MGKENVRGKWGGQGNSQRMLLKGTFRLAYMIQKRKGDRTGDRVDS